MQISRFKEYTVRASAKLLTLLPRAEYRWPTSWPDFPKVKSSESFLTSRCLQNLGGPFCESLESNNSNKLGSIPGPCLCGTYHAETKEAEIRSFDNPALRTTTVVALKAPHSPNQMFQRQSRHIFEHKPPSFNEVLNAHFFPRSRLPWLAVPANPTPTPNPQNAGRTLRPLASDPHGPSGEATSSVCTARSSSARSVLGTPVLKHYPKNKPPNPP